MYTSNSPSGTNIRVCANTIVPEKTGVTCRCGVAKMEGLFNGDTVGRGVRRWTLNSDRKVDMLVQARMLTEREFHT